MAAGKLTRAAALFEGMRPAGTVASLAAVFKFALNLEPFPFTLGAFATWLGDEHAALSFTYQANVSVLTESAAAFTPGACLRRVLDDRHYHNYPYLLLDWCWFEINTGPADWVRSSTAGGDTAADKLRVLYFRRKIFVMNPC